DSADEVYRLSWTTDSGAVRHQAFTDLVAAVEEGEQTASSSGAVTGTTLAEDTDIDDFAAGVELTVLQEVAAALLHRFGQIANTGYTPFDEVSIPQGDEVDTEALPGTVELDYSDGSTRDLPLQDWDLSEVDPTTPGTYTARTTVERDDYP